MATITKKTPITKEAKKNLTKKNSSIKIGFLKGKIKIAEDAFEEDNQKTLKF